MSLNDIALNREIEKCRNYWLSKGFIRPTMAKRILTRDDIEIYHGHGAWRMRKAGPRKSEQSAYSLVALLQSFI